MADLGRRPTGSAEHLHFIEWLERQLGAVPGMHMSAIPYDIHRWVDHGAAVEAGPSRDALRDVAVSGAPPYAAPTSDDGARRPLLDLPTGPAPSSVPISGQGRG